MKKLLIILSIAYVVLFYATRYVSYGAMKLTFAEYSSMIVHTDSDHSLEMIWESEFHVFGINLKSLPLFQGTTLSMLTIALCIAMIFLAALLLKEIIVLALQSRGHVRSGISNQPIRN